MIGGEKGIARHVSSGEEWSCRTIAALLKYKRCEAFKRWLQLAERCLRFCQETTSITDVGDAAGSATIEGRQEKAEQEEEQEGDVEAQEFLVFLQGLTRNCIDRYVKHYEPRYSRGQIMQSGYAMK